MGSAHVQVVLGGETMPEHLGAALRRVGATASFGPISEALRVGLKPTADAVVVVAPENTQTGRRRLRELLKHVAARPRATLVLRSEDSDVSPPSHPSAVPISYSSRAGAEELAVRIATMIAETGSCGSIDRTTETAQHRDARLARRYREQLRSASRLQRDLLPHGLPRFGHISFSAVYHPMDYVSGDIYDIRRLDDDHVAIALVDVEGHGVCAALLTVFIKRALIEQARRGDRSRPVRPDEVLRRLNEELLETDLTECQFAAATYALLNVRTRRVELARAGAPYPILRRASRRMELLRPDGLLVGVASNATYVLESFELAPGDSLILYSDGLEEIIRSTTPERATPAGFHSTGATGRKNGVVPHGRPHHGLAEAAPDADLAFGTYERPASRLYEAVGPDDPLEYTAPDRTITTTSWYRRLKDEGVTAALEQLTVRHDALRRLGHAVDDLTALAINVDP